MSDWNGIPDQPERSGWHIIIDNTGDRHEFWWEGPDFQYWTTTEGGDLIWSIEEMAAEYSYAGAVYSSSELAQMRKDERERAAQVCDAVMPPEDRAYKDSCLNGMFIAAQRCGERIRAITDDEGKKL